MADVRSIRLSDEDCDTLKLHMGTDNLTEAIRGVIKILRIRGELNVSRKEKVPENLFNG